MGALRCPRFRQSQPPSVPVSHCPPSTLGSDDQLCPARPRCFGTGGLRGAGLWRCHLPVGPRALLR
eukprot:7867335-Alexandrium_andersonii.AAC.1